MKEILMIMLKARLEKIVRKVMTAIVVFGMVISPAVNAMAGGPQIDPITKKPNASIPPPPPLSNVDPVSPAPLPVDAGQWPVEQTPVVTEESHENPPVVAGEAREQGQGGALVGQVAPAENLTAQPIKGDTINQAAASRETIDSLSSSS
ncbi:hypothetical protein AGMMS50222_06380 [Endomicrobiia bacterium]|nr:hypothetical protein AGMMS49556_06230 [Endomicrobiia bacterium]GHT75432.1 hypothetical protein AGMMS50222_06380 [Endomicrobiia bacterium]